MNTILLLQRQAGNAAVAQWLNRSSRLSVEAERIARRKETTSGPPVQRVLDATKLNVVGEDHDESNPRRNLEKNYSFAKTNTHNYWTEEEFPGGDLMELRAIYAAAVFIKLFVGLAAGARELATDLAGGRTGQSGSTQTLETFFRKLAYVPKAMQHLEGSARMTGNTDVNRVVNAVFRAGESILKTFVQKWQVALGDANQRIESLTNLHMSSLSLKMHVPELWSLVGSSGDLDPSMLAQAVQIKRSSWMGVAAESSRAKGVWKVGDGHVADLLGGKTKVGLVNAHYERRETFNEDVDAWQRARLGDT